MCEQKLITENRQWLENNLMSQLDALDADTTFFANGLILTEEEYRKKFNTPTCSQELLKNLCWERVEYNSLLVQAQYFKEKLYDFLSLLNPTVKGF